ncbi:TetR/AcrR family transcriptional regulator [Paracoccus sediminis]|nr:TetR/AcrR family transcriptional regulator [Paracoccus sediminis]SNR39608.1 transcriptional regulator, TetR family [Paracoccus sediminis]
MKTQTVSQGRKFRQVVGGATAVFLRDGFAGASVDDIAREAGVSKATLYSYFPDKTLMFQEAMRAEIARLEDSFALDIDIAAGPDRGVMQMLARMAAWLVDPLHLGLYRVMVAEAPRFGPLSADFHATVARILCDRIQPCLDRWVDVGLLSIDDTDLAAAQLVALAGASLRDPVLLGQPRAGTDAVIRETSAQAADLFLRAFAPVRHHTMGRRSGTR